MERSFLILNVRSGMFHTMKGMSEEKTIAFMESELKCMWKIFELVPREVKHTLEIV